MWGFFRIFQIGCRFLIGIGVGLASCVAPLYIQELSPTRLRGRMVVLNVVMITGGQVIAYAIGTHSIFPYALSHG